MCPQANKVTKEKTLWPLHEPVTFQHEMDFEMADIPAPVAQSAGIKWNARVSDTTVRLSMYLITLVTEMRPQKASTCCTWRFCKAQK